MGNGIPASTTDIPWADSASRKEQQDTVEPRGILKPMTQERREEIRAYICEQWKCGPREYRSVMAEMLTEIDRLHNQHTCTCNRDKEGQSRHAEWCRAR